MREIRHPSVRFRVIQTMAKKALRRVFVRIADVDEDIGRSHRFFGPVSRHFIHPDFRGCNQIVGCFDGSFKNVKRDTTAAASMSFQHHALGVQHLQSNRNALANALGHGAVRLERAEHAVQMF